MSVCKGSRAVDLVQTFERNSHTRQVGGGVGGDEPQRDAVASGEVEIVVVKMSVHMRLGLQHHIAERGLSLEGDG